MGPNEVSLVSLGLLGILGLLGPKKGNSKRGLKAPWRIINLVSFI